MRRALRTLEVCLSLEPDCFAASRDSDDAVRVEAIDPSDWSLSYVNGGGTHTQDPVTFADTDVVTEAEDVRVRRPFDADALAKRCQQDPAEGVHVRPCRLVQDRNLYLVQGHQLPPFLPMEGRRIKFCRL